MEQHCSIGVLAKNRKNPGDFEKFSQFRKKLEE
jgi:hypothetical protein